MKREMLIAEEFTKIAKEENDKMLQNAQMVQMAQMVQLAQQNIQSGANNTNTGAPEDPKAKDQQNPPPVNNPPNVQSVILQNGKTPMEMYLEAKSRVNAMYGDEETTSIVYKISIGVLAALALIAAFAGFIMVWRNADGDQVMPESLVAIGSASVGALVGIFAPSPNKNP